MKSLLHYLQVYRQFVTCSFVEATSYRVHFLLMVTMDLVFYVTSLASIDFIFQHVSHVGVWGRGEFLFFTSFMLAMDSIHMTFVAENFWYLGGSIQQGTLDFDLLKPIGSVFISFFRHFRPATMGNVVLTHALLCYFGWSIQLQTSAWLALPVMIVLGFLLLVQLEILLSCSMFYLVDGHGINFLRMQFQQLSRWPDFVFQWWPRKILTIVFPILLVGNAPTRFLINFDDWVPFAGLLIANVVTWQLIRVAWSWGLRRYESASS